MLLLLQIIALLLYCTGVFLIGIYGKIKVLKLQDELGADDSFREQKQFFWTTFVYLAGAVGMAYSLWAFVAVLAGLYGLGYGERLYPKLKEELHAKMEEQMYNDFEQAKEYLDQVPAVKAIRRGTMR